MPNLFNSVKLFKPKKNVFDLSHDVKFSCDMGELIPTLVHECVPGDSYTIGCESLLRFAPLVAPIMHRVDCYMHYFFVPNRLVWSSWEQFITGGDAGSGQPAAPYVDIAAADYLSYPLIDYMGIPEVTGANTLRINPIAFAAYQKICNEYYRDENVGSNSTAELDDNDNTFAFAVANGLAQMRRRAWMHDYFTSSLPFAQKGAAVTLPIAGFNDVAVLRNTASAPDPLTVVDVAIGPDPLNIGNLPSPSLAPVDDTLYAQTSELDAQSATINDLRRAFRLQEWLEKNARAGTRYVESILAHFGVKSSDARLQRPEYITGTKSPVNFSEVLNTAGTFDPADPADPSSPPQGNMAGHGIGVTSGKYGKYFCEEHGFIIGIMSVMPRTAYQQGVARQFTRFDKFDYYWNDFANIGEQEVKNKEIFADSVSATQEATFGYVPRYAEYKYIPSRVAGQFKSSLDYWHLGRIFTSTPPLQEAFIECVPDKRIFAVTDTSVDSLYCHVLHKIKAVRPMPKYGTPSF